MNRSILYAEDENESRSLLTQVLMEAGYDVEAVEDGNAAIQRLGERSFDLLLLDIRMPGKGGLEVLQYLREQRLNPRVVMLTAVNELTAALTSIKLGANDYVTKPFDIQHLLGLIERLLRE